MITRIGIYLLAALILSASLIYSNYLAERLAQKEKEGVELYAAALDFVGNLSYEEQPSSSPVADEALDFILSRLVLQTDSLVPLILVGEEGDTSTANLTLSPDPQERSRQVRTYIKEFKEAHEPILVEFAEGRYQKVYYGESFVLKQLRWFPVAQLAVAFVFIGVVFIGFAIAKRNEQNRVWVGMAKETAHQLGTPVSSLMGWIELLRLRLTGRQREENMLNEMEDDVRRLENITERFSKIGSKPELRPEPVEGVLERSTDYLRKRISSRGNFSMEVQNQLPKGAVIRINPQLFDWVIENLLKNALDAMPEGKGSIQIVTGERGAHYFIDVTDSGKGIPKRQQSQVFQPGFTTKKRGWGLGLSLTKRIVENYHKGRIFVKYSEVGRGTTFRVLLPK